MHNFFGGKNKIPEDGVDEIPFSDNHQTLPEFLTKTMIQCTVGKISKFSDINKILLP